MANGKPLGRYEMSVAGLDVNDAIGPTSDIDAEANSIDGRLMRAESPALVDHGNRVYP